MSDYNIIKSESCTSRAGYIVSLREKLKHFVVEKLVKPALNRRSLYYTGFDRDAANFVDRLDDEVVYYYMANDAFVEPEFDASNPASPPPEPVVTDEFDENIVNLITTSMSAAFTANTQSLINTVKREIRLTNATHLNFEVERRSGILLRDHESLAVQLDSALGEENRLKDCVSELNQEIYKLQMEVRRLELKLAKYEPKPDGLEVIPSEELRKCKLDYVRFQDDDIKGTEYFSVIGYGTRDRKEYATIDLDAKVEHYYAKIFISGGGINPFIVRAGPMLTELLKNKIKLGHKFLVKTTGKKVIRKELSTNYGLDVREGQ